MSQKEEVVFPYPETLREAPVTTECRSTLLVASLHALRGHGLQERYERAMPDEDLATIASAVAGMWLPIRVGVAHYAACDALGLPVKQQLQLGGESVHKMQRTFLGTVLKTVNKGVGMTPWFALSKFTGIYQRMFQGGGARVVKLGEKEARVDIIGTPLARIGYFRVAFGGFIEAGCHFFSSKVAVSEIPRLCTKDTLGYRIVWP